MRYIQGTDRNQTTLLPEVMDDYVQENNYARKGFKPPCSARQGIPCGIVEFGIASPEQYGNTRFIHFQTKGIQCGQARILALQQRQELCLRR